MGGWEIFFQKNFLVVVFSPGVDGICGIPLKPRSSALQTKLENLNWCRLFGSVLESAILCLFFWTNDRDCRIACCSCRILYAEHTVISLTVTEIRLNLRLPDWEVPSPPVEVTEQQEGEVNGT